MNLRRAAKASKNVSSSLSTSDLNTLGLANLEGLSSEVKRLAGTASAHDEKLVTGYELCALEVLRDAPTSHSAQALDLLVNCAFYFDCVGDTRRALDAISSALTFSSGIENPHVERRIHSIAATTYARLCDFTAACRHLEKAYSLAIVQKCETARLSALVNTVSVLECIGLASDARDVAYIAAKCSAMRLEDKQLHVINAHNGMKICHSLNDLDGASHFYRIALENYAVAKCLLTETSLAYYHAACTEHLIRLGNIGEASANIEGEIAARSTWANARVEVLLLCAKAEVRLAQLDVNGIQTSISEIERLLSHSNTLPYHREEMLKLLIRLSLAARADDRRSLRLYMGALTEHMIGVKHKLLYEVSSKDLGAKHEAPIDRLPFPEYAIPEWLRTSIVLPTSRSAKPSEGRRSFGATIPSHTLPDLAEFDVTELESALRSKEFNLAENWAIACEIARGRDARHCFRVSEIAALLAYATGHCKTESTRIGMACRLYNIGHITTAFRSLESSDEEALSQFALVNQHTLLGGRLLAASHDEVLSLGAIVASGHHEWWNGCGQPAGVGGAAIPLAARICAVAKCFVGLVFPNRPAKPWRMEAALEQMGAMAGVQLDPALVELLKRASTQNELPFNFQDLGERTSPEGFILARDNLLNAMVY